MYSLVSDRAPGSTLVRFSPILRPVFRRQTARIFSRRPNVAARPFHSTNKYATLILTKWVFHLFLSIGWSFANLRRTSHQPPHDLHLACVCQTMWSVEWRDSAQRGVSLRISPRCFEFTLRFVSTYPFLQTATRLRNSSAVKYEGNLER